MLEIEAGLPLEIQWNHIDNHSGHEELLAWLLETLGNHLHHLHIGHHACEKIIHTLKKSEWYINKSAKFQDDQ